MFQRNKNPRFLPAAFVLALLAACAGKPPAPPPAEPPKPPALVNAIEKFQTNLGDGLVLDFQVEKKLSKVNNKSCYAFITGRISNVSGRTLSKKSVLDVPVYSQGALLYRDNTSPLADIPSGNNADFEMVQSPVFANGCPSFDKINPVLRKVFL